MNVKSRCRPILLSATELRKKKRLKSSRIAANIIEINLKVKGIIILKESI